MPLRQLGAPERSEDEKEMPYLASKPQTRECVRVRGVCWGCCAEVQQLCGNLASASSKQSANAMSAAGEVSALLVPICEWAAENKVTVPGTALQLDFGFQCCCVKPSQASAGTCVGTRCCCWPSSSLQLTELACDFARLAMWFETALTSIH